jgi:hypothetical protein
MQSGAFPEEPFKQCRVSDMVFHRSNSAGVSAFCSVVSHILFGVDQQLRQLGDVDGNAPASSRVMISTAVRRPGSSS